jgi:hypothetical protein
LQAENAALRNQLFMYRKSGQRPRIRPADRLLWCFIAKFWAGWREALYFVQPRTVTTWQKKRFRDYWRALSQSAKPGRPRISRELRMLIGWMWEVNPTWGSPKIVAELAMLGNRRCQVNGRNVSAQASRAAVAHMENISGPACSRSGIDRLFHCADGCVSGVVRLHRAGPRSTATFTSTSGISRDLCRHIWITTIPGEHTSPWIETHRTVVPYEQRNRAMLLNFRPSTAFTISICRRLHEYSGPTGIPAS